jgi:predicted Holliday junction resolvase-like endonuclease
MAAVVVGALVVALMIALGVMAWLLRREAAYRAIYRYKDSDLTMARRDSVTRSRSVVVGQVQEHLAPIAPKFLERWNPKDARFLGSPIDFVVFDGLDEGQLRSVCFVEVKAGRTAMTRRERQVRDVIEQQNVSFELVRFDPIQTALHPDNASAPVGIREPPAGAPALQP